MNAGNRKDYNIALHLLPANCRANRENIKVSKDNIVSMLTDKRIRTIAWPLLLILVGGLAGFIIRGLLDARGSKSQHLEKREGGFDFINPLLECDTADDVWKNRELQPFKTTVEEFINKRLDKRWADSVSVYFRELNDGLWFSIGETEHFTPASLRKVPMMIALLKQAEQFPGFLEKKVIFPGKRDYTLAQNIQPLIALQPGQSYAIGELISRMIAYSDNNAFTLLAGIVDGKELEKVYQALNVRPPGKEQGQEDFQSVYTYASFFRVLYNATYLSRELSGKALEALSRTDFRSGLVKGVPQTVAVAHKFGEHSDTDTQNKQLHDCGIVYYPKHPYLLCVMSKGKDFEYLDDAIAAISQIVYEQVDMQHRAH